MQNKTIVANWKMHGTAESACALAKAVAGHRAAGGVIICPPAILIPIVRETIVGSGIKLGAQDCSAKKEGAFTGDISAAMLKDAGCTHVIVGHSERRIFHTEHSATVKTKAERAIAEGLIPIVCVGEPLEQREAGGAEAFVAGQLRDSLPQKGEFIIAYEPVWAIGTGKTPTLADVSAMHRHILGLANGAGVLYGGSVKAANAAGILELPEVAGVLVGSASLDAGEFGKIIVDSIIR